MLIQHLRSRLEWVIYKLGIGSISIVALQYFVILQSKSYCRNEAKIKYDDNALIHNYD